MHIKCVLTFLFFFRQGDMVGKFSCLLITLVITSSYCVPL